MNRTASFFKCIPLVLLAAVILCFVAILPSHAATLTVVDPEIENGAFSLVITFPAEDWRGGFDFSVTYDSFVYEHGTATCSIALTNSIFNSPSSGKLNLVGSPDQNAVPGATVITVPFTVKDSSKTDSKITVKVNSLINFDGLDLIAVGTEYTVDPQEAVPPVSTDSSTETSSDSDSDTTVTSSTDSEKPTISTNTSTDSDKPTVSTSTKTSTKTSGTTDSDGTTDKTSASDTDSDQITDSETGFPFSSGSGSNTDDPTTDVTDLPGSDSESEATVTGPTIVVPSTSTLKQPADDGKIATSTVAIISIGVAALLCAGLTVLGLMRHKKVD